MADRGLSSVGSVLLLGCGKMGGAMLEGWIEGGLPLERVAVIEPAPPARLKALAGQGLTLNPETPERPEIAVLAVKPQLMAEAVPRLAPYGGGGTLFLSIAAGSTIATLERLLGAKTPVVRAMPNTPAAIGRGVTAYVGNGHASTADLSSAALLLSAVGETVALDSEAQIDAVTGLSGSGPAYVFHLIEAMAAAGVAAGLGEDMAMRLARATVCGAGALAERSNEPAAVLRENVTSPGGTTAAGLSVLMAELPDLMRRTVAAAAGRGRELARD